MLWRCAAVAGLAVAALVVGVAGGALLAAGLGGNHLLVGALGIALTVGSLIAGCILSIAVTDDDNGSWIVVIGAVAAAVAALLLPGSYLAWAGAPATATVTAVAPCADDGPPAAQRRGPAPAELRLGDDDCVGFVRLADTATGRDLGWTDCVDGLHRGASADVLVDPHGWLPPKRRSCLPSSPERYVMIAALLLYLAGPVTLIVRQVLGLAGTDPPDDDP
jgi:hypothetical protein